MYIVIGSVKAVGAVGVAVAVGRDGGAVDGAVVIIAALVIGVAVEGIVGNQAISQAAAVGVLVVGPKLRPRAVGQAHAATGQCIKFVVL